MSRHFDRERELQAQIEHLIARQFSDVEVLDIELDEPRDTIRIFISTDDGVSIEQCADVTKLIRDDFEQYNLEVSSPGLERPMRRQQHFEAALGQRVRLRSADDHRIRPATVVGASDSFVEFEGGSGDTFRLKYSEIIRCKKIPDTNSAVPAGGQGQQRKGNS